MKTLPLATEKIKFALALIVAVTYRWFTLNQNGDDRVTQEATQAGGAPLANDLLHGADEIAQYIYGTPADEKAAESNRRRVYHATDKHGLPAFKLGGTITARKTTILKWIESREQAA